MVMEKSYNFAMELEFCHGILVSRAISSMYCTINSVLCKYCIV